MDNKARGELGGGKKLLGKGYYDSRLAVANDTSADTSCLYAGAVKSLKFVALVFLGRDGSKAARTLLSS